MPFQNEPIAAMVAGCCSPLQYLEGAAYIAIVLAVLGVPQLLTHYLDQRNRRKERREDQAEAERIRREERAETERVRREERADAERRHQETLAALMAAITAMTAIVERNGHTPPEQTTVVQELRQRINRLEAENARLRAGNGPNPPESDAAGATE